MAARRDNQISRKSAQSSKFSETDTVEFRYYFEPEPYSAADLDHASGQLPATGQYAAPSGNVIHNPIDALIPSTTVVVHDPLVRRRQ
jgi:hypothetical protein